MSEGQMGLPCKLNNPIPQKWTQLHAISFRRGTSRLDDHSSPSGRGQTDTPISCHLSLEQYCLNAIIHLIFCEVYILEVVYCDIPKDSYNRSISSSTINIAVRINVDMNKLPNARHQLNLLATLNINNCKNAKYIVSKE